MKKRKKYKTNIYTAVQFHKKMLYNNINPIKESQELYSFFGLGRFQHFRQNMNKDHATIYSLNFLQIIF